MCQIALNLSYHWWLLRLYDTINNRADECLVLLRDVLDYDCYCWRNIESADRSEDMRKEKRLHYRKIEWRHFMVSIKSV